MVAPHAQVEREIRIGLVMYGGVSLAVYMNGVAQELLRLVMATAPPPGGRTAANGSEHERTPDIYREIGAELEARFVVDVLAGSSAGGINAVFLAKALATGGHLDSLRNTWLEEGDVSRLIFDRKSLEGMPGLSLLDPPPSLFNGDRMYRKLLSALNEVDPRQSPKPWVDEVDLYVTATDLHGLPVDIALSDTVVQEKRHRTVFHFQHEPVARRGDFARDGNGFLAFAARCTSSFPVAFEPLQLADLRRLWPDGPGPALDARLTDWQRFFPDYQAANVPHETRVFADGGYLDNKPFESVISCIEQRDGELPTERLLIYIEPDPEQVGRAASETAPRPHAVANALSPFTLARRETILSEIQRVNARKRYLERLRRILADVHHDAQHVPQAMHDVMPDGKWSQVTVESLVQARGAGYGAYHRAKVGAVTDGLARFVAKMVGWEEDSDRVYCLWLLVRAWRKRHFFCYEQVSSDQVSETAFLVDYDSPYRLRRLQFLKQLTDDRLEQLGAALHGGQARPSAAHGSRVSPLDLNAAGVVDELRSLRRRLGQLHREYARELRSLPARCRDQLATSPNMTLELDLKLIVQIARAASGGQTMGEPVFGDFPKPQKDLMQACAHVIAAELKNVFTRFSHALEGLLPKDADAATPAGWLRHYYDRYEDYDVAMLPLLQGTGIPQLGSLQVYRISPEDSTLRSGADKLGGSRYGAFGAFFDEDWRRNDLIWGRLDAAERLIHILLPGDDAGREARRVELVRRARRAIVREEAGALLEDRAIDALLQHVRDGEPSDTDRGRIASALSLESYLRRLQRSSPGPIQKPSTLVDVAGRAAVVMSDVLDGILRETRVGAGTRLLAHVSRVMLHFIRVSTPGHWLERPFQKIMLLTALCAGIIITLGPLVDAGLVRVGFWALGIVILSLTAQGALGAVLRGRYWLPRLGLLALGSAVLGLAAFGGHQVLERYRLDEIITTLNGLMP
jgi:patatin-related protein